MLKKKVCKIQGLQCLLGAGRVDDGSNSRIGAALLEVTMLLTENQVKQSAHAVTSPCVQGTEPFH